MPLETPTYLSGLVTANPAHVDGMAQGDGHLRLIKSVLLATFPNFTAAALNSTQAAIDAAVAAVTGGTVTVGAGSAGSPSLSVNGQGGLYSPGAHQVGIETNGVSAVVVNSDQSVNFAGQLVLAAGLSAFGAISGKGALPVGVPLMWLTDTAPTGYLMANGQAVSRTTYSALFTVYGTSFGIGDGSTTFNLPNMQEIVPIGKSTMGGAASPGRVTHQTLTTTGAIAGEERHTLAQAELPAVAPTFTGTLIHLGTLTVNPTGDSRFVQGHNGLGGTASAAGGVDDAVLGDANVTIPDFTPAGTISNLGSGTSLNVVQPCMVVNFIVYAGV